MQIDALTWEKFARFQFSGGPYSKVQANKQLADYVHIALPDPFEEFLNLGESPRSIRRVLHAHRYSTAVLTIVEIGSTTLEIPINCLIYIT